MSALSAATPDAVPSFEITRSVAWVNRLPNDAQRSALTRGAAHVAYDLPETRRGADGRSALLGGVLEYR